MPYTDEQKRQHIIELQRYLYAIASAKKTLPLIIPHWVYDEATENAVSEFQRTHNLPVTGETDPTTWDAIVAEYMAVNSRKAAALPVFPSSHHICEKGASGLTVYVIQAILKDLHSIFDNLPDVTVSGTFDSATETAIAEFRRICGLSEGSHVDCETWNMLVNFCGHKF